MCMKLKVSHVVYGVGSRIMYEAGNSGARVCVCMILQTVMCMTREAALCKMIGAVMCMRLEAALCVHES